MKNALARLEAAVQALDASTLELNNRRNRIEQTRAGLRVMNQDLQSFINLNVDLAQAVEIDEQAELFTAKINNARQLMAQNPEMRWRNVYDSYDRAVRYENMSFLNGVLKAGRVEPGTANSVITRRIDGETLLFWWIRQGHKAHILKLLDIFRDDLKQASKTGRCAD
jgi:hypothetical protein